MKTKTEKLKIEAPQTWAEAERAMREYSEKFARLETRKSTLEEALALVRAEFEPAIAETAEELEGMARSMESFAEAHKAEFKAAPDGDGRSYEHAAVTIGFRKMPPSVKLPHRTADREAALKYLEIYRPTLVRMTPEFDKPAILRTLDDGGEVLAAALGDHGIKLNPGKDEFFVKSAE